METTNDSVSRLNSRFVDVDLVSKDPETPDIEAQSADLYTLKHNGLLQAARNTTTNELEAGLKSFNQSFYEQDDQAVGNCSGVLSIIRFDEATPSLPVNMGLSASFHSQAASRSESRPQSVHRVVQPAGAAPTLTLDLQKLRNSFDGKCVSAFCPPALRLKKGDAHCQWSNSKCVVSPGVRCLKFSYSMRTPDSKALSLSHHFHTILGQEVEQNDIAEEYSKIPKEKELEGLHKSKSSPASLPTISHPPPQDSTNPISVETPNGWKPLVVSKSFPQYGSKEMVRGFTVGLDQKEFDNILSKARIVEFIELPGDSTYSKPRPHPKAILLGILEDFERRQRDQIKRQESYIEIIEAEIKDERRSSYKNENGLAGCSIKLSKRNLYLGQMRPKLQYLTSAVDELQSCPGMPQSINELSFLFPKKAIREKPEVEREQYFGRFWTHQLSEINSRLSHLKSKGEQCKVNVETLQFRVTGNLLMVSNLLQQREKDWIHDTEKHRTLTYNYQVEMLQKQGIIATKTQRDGTVMKVLAFLTALFLPMTFIAVLFTVPFFQWGNPRNQWLLGSPFKLYLEITMTITAIMMISFFFWFYRLWNEDRAMEKKANDEKAERDLEDEEEKRKEERALKEYKEAEYEFKTRYLEAKALEGEDG